MMLNCKVTYLTIFDLICLDAKQNFDLATTTRINQVILMIFKICLTNKGGVEDTRFEAKAKDTKNSEAKAKDLGHKHKCSPPKKKGLQKFFSDDLQFIGAPRIFDWGRPKPQITCNDVIKIFPKRKFLWDKDIVGWKT